MSKRSVIFTVVAFLLAFCACFFAFSGTGKYAYEGQAGDSTAVEPVELPEYANVTIIEINPYEGLPADECLDDEFDLLDDDEKWIWFTRLQVYVLMDGNGCLHYGKSIT